MPDKKVYAFASKYDELTDEELISKIKQGDKSAQNALFEKYKDIVNMKANKFYIIGAEREDMVQEGLIGLYKAVKSFDKAKSKFEEEEVREEKKVQKNRGTNTNRRRSFRR